jgi:hypothetical protein
MALPPDQVIRRADVFWRSTLDGVLVRPHDADEVVKLEGTGEALWAALEEPLRFRELCEVLARSHDADAATIGDDLEPVIADLIARRVVATP